MKRKHLVSSSVENIRINSDNNIANYTRSKKPRLCNLQLPTKSKKSLKWISATKTRNFMINDTLVDWLYYKKNKNQNRYYKNQNTDTFNNFIMEKGNTFEKEIIKYIDTNNIPIVSVSETITDDSVNKTIELMKEGVPIIHSAPVRDYRNRTHGIIDLLVRSDYLDKIVKECPLTKEEISIPSPFLNHNFHYVVIDVKFSTLPLKSDGRHLLNSKNYPAYKAQCLIYTNAIGLIQGYTSRYAFILGRRWKYKQNDITFNNSTCLDKLGVIDYEKVDRKYVEETNKAIKWIRDINKNGSKWSVSPPSRSELYPNMCLDSGSWQSQKQEIADSIGEISNVWYCGVKNRQQALLKGISSWKDPKCTSSNIGIKGSRASVIDKILDINRQDVDKIRPKKILNNIDNWKEDCNEMFVDFETVSDIFGNFDELPKQSSTDMIFMIGVYWKKDKKWIYTNFICNELTYNEEYRIMEEFSTFIKNNNNPKLWYWCAEKSFWERAENRQYEFNYKNKNIITKWNHKWVDMCNIFKKEPIVIKDCFKFGLKPIATAMKNHGLINTMIKSDCKSGMSAMILAWNCYKDELEPSQCSVMKDIAEYNKFDVKVMKDILFYLRKNHC